MKIPGIGQKSTAERLKLARALLDACNAKIAQLESDRAGLLCDDDEIDKLRALAEALAKERGAAADLVERIRAIELRLADEKEKQRQRDLVAAIDQVEATLPTSLADFASQLG